MALKRGAIFIDKDGTLIPDIPHNVDPDRITLFPFAVRGLKLLQRQGFSLFMVSNQSGIAHGLFEEADLHPVTHRIDHLLARDQVRLNGWYFCPHHPDGKVPAYAVTCDCRKPLPGMLHRAATEHDIDLARSWMIGDILNDIESGRRAGCRTILINNGNETEWSLSSLRLPHLVTFNLFRAAEAILMHEAQR
jgi:D-glycero-D-manno-heptose 1,7-bisphosphate phosphatase